MNEATPSPSTQSNERVNHAAEELNDGKESASRKNLDLDAQLDENDIPSKNDIDDPIKNKATDDSKNNAEKKGLDQEQDTEGKAAIDDTEIDLTKPLKKARTAYFIFMQEKRSVVIKDLTNGTSSIESQNEDEKEEADKDNSPSNSSSSTNTSKASVTMVAKRIGELWSALSIEEKEGYHEKAKKEKEVYKKHYNALIKAGVSPSSIMSSNSPQTTSNSEQKNENDMIFPLSRIRKICRLDPEVKGMSKESTILVTKALECFLGRMANDAWSMAKMHQKRTIHAQDVLDTCSLKETFFFLRDDIKDLIHEQKEDKKRKRELKKSSLGPDYRKSSIEDDGQGKSKVSKTVDTIGVKPLTSYFATANNK